MEQEVISQELMDVLACPDCKQGLELTEYGNQENGVYCRKCKLIFPIRNGIPVMLLDEAIEKK